jgi:hypothetical protein
MTSPDIPTSFEIHQADMSPSEWSTLLGRIALLLPVGDGYMEPSSELLRPQVVHEDDFIDAAEKLERPFKTGQRAYRVFERAFLAQDDAVNEPDAHHLDMPAVHFINYRTRTLPDGQTLRMGPLQDLTLDSVKRYVNSVDTHLEQMPADKRDKYTLLPWGIGAVTVQVWRTVIAQQQELLDKSAE